MFNAWRCYVKSSKEVSYLVSYNLKLLHLLQVQSASFVF